MLTFLKIINQYESYLIVFSRWNDRMLGLTMFVDSAADIVRVW